MLGDVSESGKNDGRVDGVVDAGGAAPDADARAARGLYDLRDPGGAGGGGRQLYGDLCVPPRPAAEEADELLHCVVGSCGLSCRTLGHSVRDPGVSGAAEKPPRVPVHSVVVSDVVHD